MATIETEIKNVRICGTDENYLQRYCFMNNFHSDLEIIVIHKHLMLHRYGIQQVLATLKLIILHAIRKSRCTCTPCMRTAASSGTSGRESTLTIPNAQGEVKVNIRKQCRRAQSGSSCARRRREEAGSYLDLVVQRARLRRQQRAQLDAAGGGSARVAAASAAAGRHLRAATLCAHTLPSAAAAPRRSGAAATTRPPGATELSRLEARERPARRFTALQCGRRYIQRGRAANCEAHSQGAAPPQPAGNTHRRRRRRARHPAPVR